MSVITQTEAPRAARTRRGVPWSTVLPLAIVMAYADGYWMISIRGAVGAIERNQTPFDNWWRESTLSVPLFALAVLGAITVSKRLFGPDVRGVRAVLATYALIVAAGTAAGLGEIAANAAYDYHLQVNQMQMMKAMGGICNGNCLGRQQQATLDVHLRALAFAGKTLLLTNLAAVLWVVAMRGGLIRITVLRRQLPGRSISTRIGDIRLLLAAGLAGSAAIHAAVIREHLADWGPAGAFFILLSVTELAAAAMLFTARRRAALLAAAVVSAGPLVVWVWSRTVGIPFGPGAGVPEPVGLADCMACALEIGTLAAAVALLRGAERLGQRPATSAHIRSWAVLAVLVVTLVGLAGTRTSWFSELAGSGDQMTMTASH